MHIPDGMISPKMYIPLHVVNAGLLVYGFKRIKNKIDEKTLPYIASCAALSFVLMLLQVPLPGGTSVHGVGVAPIAIIFGPWMGFVAISLVLLIQAIFLGVGGITSFPVNALCIGFLGSFTSYYIYLFLRNLLKDKVAMFLAGFFAILVAALFIAISLGIQPMLSPYYFPFGLKTTIPVLLVPHIFVGIGEGILTVLIYEFVKKGIKNE